MLGYVQQNFLKKSFQIILHELYTSGFFPNMIASPPPCDVLCSVCIHRCQSADCSPAQAWLACADSFFFQYLTPNWGGAYLFSYVSTYVFIYVSYTRLYGRLNHVSISKCVLFFIPGLWIMTSINNQSACILIAWW